MEVEEGDPQQPTTTSKTKKSSSAWKKVCYSFVEKKV
jgi:hypothetical protein